MKKLAIILIMTVLASALFSNNLTSVLNPTAGVLSRGEARVHQKLYKNNGIKVGFEVGLFDNFNVGASYGGDELLGSDNPKWNERPDFIAKLRILDETKVLPAIAIGVDTHGHGAWKPNYAHYQRYEVKSKGAYIVGSKNFDFLGLLGIDVGANYSFWEKNENDNEPDIFFGIYKTIGDKVTLFADFSCGFNDNWKYYHEEDDKYYYHIGQGRGYLNSAVQWRLNDNFTLKFLLVDMFQNNKYNRSKIGDRAVILDYRWFF